MTARRAALTWIGGACLFLAAGCALLLIHRHNRWGLGCASLVLTGGGALALGRAERA